MQSINIATATVDDLAEIGARKWTAPNGTVRYYFNGLARLFGFELTYYNTGNLCTAKLDGETISNTQAKRYLSDLESMKVWVEEGTLRTKLAFRPTTSTDYAAKLEVAINARLATLGANRR